VEEEKEEYSSPRGLVVCPALHHRGTDQLFGALSVLTAAAQACCASQTVAHAAVKGEFPST
jgi:hypothetical protein